MALHVTSPKTLFNAQTLTATTYSNAIDVAAFSEGQLFLEVDVTTGTWTPKNQQQNPVTGVWHDRGESFSTFTPTGGPASDGKNQTQRVAVSGLGSRFRVVMTPSGAPSPIIKITAVYEGKT